MENPYAVIQTRPLRGFFGVLAWRRTYTHLLYLLIGFPLGLAYFVFFTVGLAVGLGLVVVWIGVLILLGVVLASWVLTRLERVLAIGLLGADIEVGLLPARGRGPGAYVRDVLASAGTWKGLAFVVTKFPLGLVSWIAVIVLLSVTVGLAAAPIIVATGGSVSVGAWVPTTLLELSIVSLIGLAGILPMLHLINGMGYAWQRWSEFLLGGEARNGTADSGLGHAPAVLPATS